MVNAELSSMSRSEISKSKSNPLDCQLEVLVVQVFALKIIDQPINTLFRILLALTQHIVLTNLALLAVAVDGIVVSLEEASRSVFKWLD